MTRFGLYSLVICSLLVSFSLSGQNPPTEEINKTDASGRKQGVWTKKYENGVTRYTGRFINDSPIGEFKYYDNYGVLTGSILHHGNDTAEAKFYHDGVHVMSEGKFYKMQKTGKWKFYDGDGDITSQCLFIDGKKHGMRRVYYKNGAIAKEENYVHGVLQGPVQEYFKGGVTKFKGTYRDGNLNGKVEYWYPNGVRKLTGTYEYAVRVNGWRYYDNSGRVQYIEFFKEGRLLWRRTPEELREINEKKKAAQDSLNLAPQDKK